MLYLTYFFNSKLMEKILIEKVDFNKIDKSKVLDKYFSNPAKYERFISRANSPKYLYWDKVSHIEAPDDLSSEESWFLIRQIRSLSSSFTVIKSEDNKKFMWYRLNKLDEYLHKIDFFTGGQMFASHNVHQDVHQHKFLGRGILEEAIASSQIEGANTTRSVAKKMILEKRAPRNRSELMILNNYKVMKNLEEEYKDSDLSRDLLFRIHADITEKDPEIPEEDKNRFRLDKDEIVVHDNERIAHIPPKSKFLEKEIDNLIEYANDKGDESFVHPVLKAITLHFWIGYLHPFTDGNGRLARSIFYWYLLKKGYWSMLLIPISTVIKKSRKQYDDAYLYAEQDGLDLTYFIDYNIRKMIQAIEEFSNYVDRVKDENKIVDRLLDQKYHLNVRQKQLIYHLIDEGDGSYSTAMSHSTVNNISRQTAASDLKNLQDLGLLKSKKVGYYVRYYATSKLKQNAEQ